MTVQATAKERDLMRSSVTISATELRESAERIRALRQAATEHAVEIGRELLRVKAVLPHGAFARWVEKECQFKIRTAQDLMKLARWNDSNAQHGALLVPSTLRLLMSRNVPEEVRQTILAKAKRGEQISRREISSAICQARMKSATKTATPNHVRVEPAASRAGMLKADQAPSGTDFDRARRIAELLVRRLSDDDYNDVMSGISWEVWNRVLVLLPGAKAAMNAGRDGPKNVATASAECASDAIN